jgi:ABC-type glycerol-3-phosphate transport system substrate-binding protein
MSGKKALLSSVLVLLVVLSFGALASAEPVKIRFVSLAWQEQSIAANYEIVDEWNRLNPDIQVEYIPGSWDSIHDYMVTSFETGDVPDIFHYEAALIGDFARRGYLADLRPYIDDELWEDTFEGAWATVAGDNGEIWGMPFIWESLIILYHKDILEEAGIELPTTENPWTWDDIRSVAKELTVDFDGDGEIDQWGAAIPLRAPVNRILNLTLGFGGGYFVEEDGRYTVRVGEAEKGLLSVIMDMIYEDKSAYPGAVGLSGTAVLPAFYEGDYALLPGIGVWARQQIMQNAPEDFRWGVLPPVKGQTQLQGANPQTLSIPKASKHQAEAMEFIKFFVAKENVTKLALGDWMYPTRKSALAMPEFQTEEAGWKVSSETVQFLTVGPWHGVPGFPEWKDRVATPVMQELFANQITIEEAAQRMESEGNRILQRYR